MIGHTHRLKLISGIAAVGLAVSSVGPSLAQTAPTLGSWLAGPDGAGTSTIIGRVEAPRARQNVNTSANLLVTGWAVDTTAAGWSGIDGVEVWSGAKDQGGTKLASGMAGLARSDIGDALGSSFANAGFSATVPASAWANMKAGAAPLYVYLHTPGKGTWYRSVSVNIPKGLTLDFPNDPIVLIAKPQDGVNITQKQPNSKFSFSGIALDRNPLTSVQDSLASLPPGVGQTLGPGCSACAGSTGNTYTSYRGAGISSITAYIDAPPTRGDNTVFGNFGAPCAGCVMGTSILVSNKGALNTPGKPQGSIISRQYGSQYDYSGWSLSINPTTLAPGPHTLYVTATSSITGKQSTAKVTFNILPIVQGQRVQP